MAAMRPTAMPNMLAWRMWGVKEAVTQMQDELRVGKHFKTRILIRRGF
jgi:hypothetical protein